jgi:hypothetical protein
MIQSLKGRALRHFTLSTGKSEGRNSSRRITVFHQGGGSKRLQRKKRTTSSIGIMERILHCSWPLFDFSRRFGVCPVSTFVLPLCKQDRPSFSLVVGSGESRQSMKRGAHLPSLLLPSLIFHSFFPKMEEA